jgi:predicted regulator of Ras-like GTPase activity (Roadblock/LC7/MglB family)
MEDPTFATLNAILAEIRIIEGVKGYILRNETSATIDLNEQDKIVNYAYLASQIMDSSQTITQLFPIGNLENIIVEGKNIKVLCVDKGGNKINVFMEKNTNHKDIIEKINLITE